MCVMLLLKKVMAEYGRQVGVPAWSRVEERLKSPQPGINPVTGQQSFTLLPPQWYAMKHPERLALAVAEAKRIVDSN